MRVYRMVCEIPTCSFFEDEIEVLAEDPDEIECDECEYVMSQVDAPPTDDPSAEF